MDTADQTCRRVTQSSPNNHKPQSNHPMTNQHFGSRTQNKIAKLTCILAAAGAMLYGRSALAATNVLANAGFETGSISSWTGAGGGCANGAGGAVESTNNIVYQGNNHVLTHSGTYAGKIFGDFCTASGSRPSIYQEVPTGPGSVWSGDGFAAPQTPDNIGGGNQFWFEVSFRDVAGNSLAVYRSSVIDANSPTNVYTELQVTNMIFSSDPDATNATTFAAPQGTVKVRFEVIFSQNSYDGGSVYFDDLSLTKIAGSDPEVSAPPVSLTKIEGQTAVLSSTSSGTSALSYEWDKTDTNGTATVVNGGNISGATTGTLTITNVVTTNAGQYALTVTDNNGSQTVSAQLKVVPLAQVQTNILINPGFEDGVYTEPWETGWITFNGNFLANTNKDYYYLSATPVASFDGSYTAQIYPTGNGSYNGLFQDKPAAPGEVYTANAKFFTSSQDEIGGNNICYLEVQFRDQNSNPLAQYSSTNIDSTSPTDTWITLSPTNHRAGDFSTFLGISPYMVAPPGTAFVRFQFTYHAVDAGGSVYVDAADLRLREPVAAVTAVSNKLNITFPTLYGPTYNVLYRTNLNDTSWQTLTNIVGDGTVKSVADTLSGTHRYYIVNTQ